MRSVGDDSTRVPTGSVEAPAGHGDPGRRLTDREILDLAERLAVAVRTHRRLDLPIDALRWCTAAGVRLEWVTGFEEGQYVHGVPRPTVQVRPDLERRRRNVIVVHELGHHFVDQARRVPALRRRLSASALRRLSRIAVGGDEEERLCDAFAGAILLPTAAVLEVGRKDGFTVLSVSRLAGRYEVTESLVEARASQLGHTSIP